MAKTKPILPELKWDHDVRGSSRLNAWTQLPLYMRAKEVMVASINLMNTIQHIPIIIAGMYLALGLGSNALAELKLPNGGDRRPNLSADPFERAREAVRKLPTVPAKSAPAKTPVAEDPPPETKKATRRAPEPAPEPPARVVKEDPTPPPADKGGGEDAAFTQSFTLTLDGFTKTAGGVLPAEVDDPLTKTVDETIPLNSNAFVGLLDYVAQVNTSAAGLWENGSIVGHVSAMFGTNPSDTVGDLHGVSSIAAGFTAIKIMEAYYQHTFPLSGTVVTAGVFDVNTDFVVSEYSNLFVNGAFGFDNVLSQSAGPSNFPNTALGVEMKTDVSINAYVQAALFDGAPESEGKKFIDFKTDRDGGVFSILETGWHEGEAFTPGYYKIAVGGWYLKQPMTAFGSEEKDAPVFPGTGGMYLLAETSIGETLGLFFRAGRADADFNKYSQFYAAGINYKGLIPGREEDLLGVGFVQTRLSNTWLNAKDDPNGDAPDQTNGIDMDGNARVFPAETTYEVTYSSQIFPWLTVQPTFQYVLQPSMDIAKGNAAVFGIRLQATY